MIHVLTVETHYALWLLREDRRQSRIKACLTWVSDPGSKDKTSALCLKLIVVWSNDNVVLHIEIFLFPSDVNERRVKHKTIFYIILFSISWNIRVSSIKRSDLISAVYHLCQTSKVIKFIWSLLYNLYELLESSYKGLVCNVLYIHGKTSQGSRSWLK